MQTPPVKVELPQVQAVGQSGGERCKSRVGEIVERDHVFEGTPKKGVIWSPPTAGYAIGSPTRPETVPHSCSAPGHLRPQETQAPFPWHSRMGSAAR